MQFWKPNYLEGSEKKKQDSVDIDDHPVVQFPVHFFFLGCSVSKCHCSSRFASISVRNLHPFCWGFAITWQFVSTLGWSVVYTLSVQMQFSVAVTKNEIKEAAWDFRLRGHEWKKSMSTAVFLLRSSSPWLCSSLFQIICILEKLTFKHIPEKIEVGFITEYVFVMGQMWFRYGWDWQKLKAEHVPSSRV